MDNRQIDVTSEGLESLGKALELIWPSAAGGKATHYIQSKFKEEVSYYQNKKGLTTHHYSKLVEDQKGTDTLILLWSQSGDKRDQKLPFPLKLEDAKSFVSGWLDSLNWGHEPDHDGSNGKGWRVFTEAWGHVAGNHYAIVAVQPAWAMYGK